MAVTHGSVPLHVAWVAAGSERWRPQPGGPASLAESEKLALGELVDCAAAMGVRWLTVQEPSGGGPLEAPTRPGVRVLRREPGVPLGATTDDGLLVVLEPAGSGRRELVDAIQTLADAGVDPKDVGESAIERSLDLPDVDLLVKSGGDRRVPDLLLWQSAYSELVFLDVLWPDVRREHLLGAVEEYRRRERRYGGVVSST